MEDFCTPNILNKLLHNQSISTRLPWASERHEDIDDFYRGICNTLCKYFSLSSDIVWNSYGCGYASYIDAFFYHYNHDSRKAVKDKSEEYTILKPPDQIGRYRGLVILFNRLAPYFVVGQGDKSFHAQGSASYIPDYGFVDYLTHTGAINVLADIEPYLLQQGLTRLHARDVDGELAIDPSAIPEAFCNVTPPYRIFDALFHWAD